jgi:ComF family protein
VVCSRWTRRGVCSECADRFAAHRLRCVRCAIALPGIGHDTCGACLADPPPWRRAVCAVDYAFPWDGLVAGFKFRNRPELARLFGDMLAREVRRQDAAREVEIVLPVPLADARLKERGYDQAWELSKFAARNLRLQATAEALCRPVDTVAQSSLDRAARARNLLGAFQVPADRRTTVSGRRVALVDDVMTTGASFRAATLTLIEAEAKSVDVWCLARTP